MGILIDKATRVLVQGITGNEGLYQTQRMINYGTNIVAGVSPGKGGDWVLDGKVPVFDSIRTAVEMTGADASVIFVPAKSAPDAIIESVDADLPLIVCVTEGIPVKDMVKIRSHIAGKKIHLIGPNCPGIQTPGQSSLGVIPGFVTIPGNVGVVSRSATLMFEVMYVMKKAKIGVSTCVGIGGDAVLGTDFVDVLAMFESDPHTEKIVIIGEIGGDGEEKAAEFIMQYITKPIVALVVGQTVPIGVRMGHAGALIEGGLGKADVKIKMLQQAGALIATGPDDFPELLDKIKK